MFHFENRRREKLRILCNSETENFPPTGMFNFQIMIFVLLGNFVTYTFNFILFSSMKVELLLNTIILRGRIMEHRILFVFYFSLTM